MENNVGDILAPKDEFVDLVSGSNRYDCAVMVSQNPFVLVSLESDMRWEATIKEEDFKKVGVSESEVMRRCLRRLVS